MAQFPVDILEDGARMLDITLSPAMLQQLTDYADLLVSWNEKVNLTAILVPRDIAEKHFLDSLSVLAVLPTNAFSLIDVGSGAGFPGLVLAIARPDTSITLVEATAKKAGFLEAVVAALKLKNVKVVIGRAETIAHQKEFREKFDVATARAVAQLAALVELTLPFVKVGGIVVAQKLHGSESVESAAGALSALGGAFTKEIAIPLPALSNRRLLVVEKIATTPSTYPRRPGIPEKKPLLG